MRSNIDRKSFIRILEIFVREMNEASESDVPLSLEHNDVKDLLGFLEDRATGAFQELDEVAREVIGQSLANGTYGDRIKTFKEIRNLTGEALGKIKRTVEMQFPKVAEEFLKRSNINELDRVMIQAQATSDREINARYKR